MSKWKCISRPDGESRNFTVGKVYELDDVTDELTGDSGYRYGTKHRNADCGGTIAFLQGCEIMFEEVTNMFGKSDLKTGMLVRFRRGTIGVVMLKCYEYSDKIIEVNATSDAYALSLGSYEEDLSYSISMENQFDIMEVRKPMLYPDLSHVDKEFKRSEVIWKREEPKELTVAELEKLLGYKVKVVTDKKEE